MLVFINKKELKKMKDTIEQDNKTISNLLHSNRMYREIIIKIQEAMKYMPSDKYR